VGFISTAINWQGKKEKRSLKQKSAAVAALFEIHLLEKRV